MRKLAGINLKKQLIFNLKNFKKMSLNTLLESANPYQSVQSDAARLANKWEKTGLLEGMNGAHKNNMGLILENQAKQLVVESSQTGGGVGTGGTFYSNWRKRWCSMGWSCFTISTKSIRTNCCTRICISTTNEFTFRSSIFLRFPIWK